jgi:tetratricopeptide (TPR) repeat protein
MNRIETRRRETLILTIGRVVGLLTLLSVLSPLAAGAAELTPQQKLEMRQIYDRATRAYDVGKYAEAIDYYQKAYEIGGDPPMLYNIAQSYRLNDQPADAVRFYRRYLQRASNPRNKEDVERKIAELEKVVEERRKAQEKVAPAPAPTPPPTTTPVAPPPAAPPVQPSTSAVPSASPGSGDTAGSAASGATPTSPSSETDGDSGHSRRVAGWIVAGVGAAAGVGAVVAGLIAKSNADKVTSASQAMGKNEFNPNLEKDGKNANTAMIALAIGAGALVATGAILIVIGSSSSEVSTGVASVHTPRAAVTPWLGGGVVGAGATLRF